MNFKAIVYDTKNKKPMETTVRCIHCSKNGKPERLTAHNGMQYKKFHIWDDSQPCKWNNYKSKMDDIFDKVNKAGKY